MRRLLTLLLPSEFFVGDDRLTYSAGRLLVRLLVVLIAVVMLAVALGLLDATNWREVSAGALLAWTVSAAAWAVNSYRKGQDETSHDLSRVAERDALHARMNHLAAALGAPLVNLNEGELDDAIAYRKQRLAHLHGLEEFGDGEAARHDFWDDLACGYPPEQGE